MGNGMRPKQSASANATAPGSPSVASAAATPEADPEKRKAVERATRMAKSRFGVAMKNRQTPGTAPTGQAEESSGEAGKKTMEAFENASDLVDVATTTKDLVGEGQDLSASEADLDAKDNKPDDQKTAAEKAEEEAEKKTDRKWSIASLVNSIIKAVTGAINLIKAIGTHIKKYGADSARFISLIPDMITYLSDLVSTSNDAAEIFTDNEKSMGDKAKGYLQAATSTVSVIGSGINLFKAFRARYIQKKIKEDQTLLDQTQKEAIDAHISEKNEEASTGYMVKSIIDLGADIGICVSDWVAATHRKNSKTARNARFTSGIFSVAKTGTSLAFRAMGWHGEKKEKDQQNQNAQSGQTQQGDPSEPVISALDAASGNNNYIEIKDDEKTLADRIASLDKDELNRRMQAYETAQYVLEGYGIGENELSTLGSKAEQDALIKKQLA